MHRSIVLTLLLPLLALALALAGTGHAAPTGASGLAVGSTSAATDIAGSVALYLHKQVRRWLAMAGARFNFANAVRGAASRTTMSGDQTGMGSSNNGNQGRPVNNPDQMMFRHEVAPAMFMNRPDSNNNNGFAGSDGEFSGGAGETTPTSPAGASSVGSASTSDGTTKNPGNSKTVNSNTRSRTAEPSRFNTPTRSVGVADPTPAATSSLVDLPATSAPPDVSPEPTSTLIVEQTTQAEPSLGPTLTEAAPSEPAGGAEPTVPAGEPEPQPTEAPPEEPQPTEEEPQPTVPVEPPVVVPKKTTLRPAPVVKTTVRVMVTTRPRPVTTEEQSTTRTTEQEETTTTTVSAEPSSTAVETTPAEPQTSSVPVEPPPTTTTTTLETTPAPTIEPTTTTIPFEPPTTTTEVQVPTTVEQETTTVEQPQPTTTAAPPPPPPPPPPDNSFLVVVVNQEGDLGGYVDTDPDSFGLGACSSVCTATFTTGPHEIHAFSLRAWPSPVFATWENGANQQFRPYTVPLASETKTVTAFFTATTVTTTTTEPVPAETTTTSDAPPTSDPTTTTTPALALPPPPPPPPPTSSSFDVELPPVVSVTLGSCDQVTDVDIPFSGHMMAGAWINSDNAKAGSVISASFAQGSTSTERHFIAVTYDDGLYKMVHFRVFVASGVAYAQVVDAGYVETSEVNGATALEGQIASSWSSRTAVSTTLYRVTSLVGTINSGSN